MSTLDRPTSQLRVLLADVEGSARRAVAGLLQSLDGITLVGEVGALGDIGAAVRHTGAEIVIIDDRLLRAIDHALARWGPLGTPVRVLVVGVDDDPAFAARAHKLGAHAWIRKDRADEELPALLVRP